MRKGVNALKYSTFNVPSLTVGLKAKKALAKRGIKSKIVKNDLTGERNGCAYAIEFYDKDYYDVVNILRSNGIPYSTNSGG